MTKREKIINYLTDEGIIRKDMLSLYITEKWPKSGTVVINRLNDDQWRRLYFDLYQFNQDSKIEIHRIRDHFKTQYGYYRISWIGD